MKKLVTCSMSVCYGHEDIWNFIIDEEIDDIKNYMFYNPDKFDYKKWTKAYRCDLTNKQYISRTQIKAIQNLNSIMLIEV